MSYTHYPLSPAELNTLTTLHNALRKHAADAQLAGREAIMVSVPHLASFFALTDKQNRYLADAIAQLRERRVYPNPHMQN